MLFVDINPGIEINELLIFFLVEVLHVYINTLAVPFGPQLSRSNVRPASSMSIISVSIFFLKFIYISVFI